MNTYTKLKSGEWGVRIDGRATPGATVTVTKKSGENKTERIGRVLWTDGKASLCTISQTKTTFRAAPAAHRYPRVSAGHWLCKACEEENPLSSSSCWECGCPR